MSLLSVAVKRAKFIGDQAAHLNTYVILKLQNVKTSTAPIKGAEPEWNQDFLFETSSVNTALLVEVWSKNILLDRAIGYQLIPLGTLPYVQYEYPTENEQWYNIDAEQIIINNEVQGTKEPTGHLILLDLHFELPFDVDTQNNDQLTNKINYNNIDYNTEQYIENYKSYGDYTSTDYNCTNASLHGTQYDQLETPYSSLENSRQNSYERDERQLYDINNLYNNQNQGYPLTYQNDLATTAEYEEEDLYYNSRPMNNRILDQKSVENFNESSLDCQDSFFVDDSSKDILDNCSDQNYSCHLNDGFYDDYSYNQKWQNGDSNVYGMLTGSKKNLPQPPSTYIQEKICYSQSVNDELTQSRGASLPVTPISNQRYNRQLPNQIPKNVSHSQNFQTDGLPKTEPSTSNISYLFGMGGSTKHTPIVSESSKRSLFSSLLGREPQEPESVMKKATYNDNYNYNYHENVNFSDNFLNHSISDNIGLPNVRLGAALPIIPSTYENTSFSNYNNQLCNETWNDGFLQRKQHCSLIGNDSVFGDLSCDSTTEYATQQSLNDGPIYRESAKKLKKLPCPVATSTSTTTKSNLQPSILTTAGSGLAGFLSSLSSSLQSPSVMTTEPSSTSYSAQLVPDKSLSNSTFANSKYYDTTLKSLSNATSKPICSSHNSYDSNNFNSYLPSSLTTPDLEESSTLFKSTLANTYPLVTNAKKSLSPDLIQCPPTSYSNSTTYKDISLPFSLSGSNYNNKGMPLSILGHSPIPEESEKDLKTYTPFTISSTLPPLTTYNYNANTRLDSTFDQSALTTAYVSSYESSGEFGLINATESIRTATTSILPSMDYHEGSSKIKTYTSTSLNATRLYNQTIEEEIFEEEYREDYEQPDCLPSYNNNYDMSVSSFDNGALTVTTSTTTTTSSIISTTSPYIASKTMVTDSDVTNIHNDYDTSSYYMNSKLSTIPETASDIYLSTNDLTPGAYAYTEVENDIIASGDLKNTNLNESSNKQQNLLSLDDMNFSRKPLESVKSSMQPEQKKSRFGFGSLLSDGLNVIESSVNSIKSTATNLAGGALGVVTSTNQTTNYSTPEFNTLIQNQSTAENNLTSSQSNSKLTKQSSQMYYDANEYNECYDHDQESYMESDYFNEEDETRYLAEIHSPNNNYLDHQTYDENQAEEYETLSIDNKINTTDEYSRNIPQICNNSNKLNDNDSNNNANSIYGNFSQTPYDNNENKTMTPPVSMADDYYKMYDENLKNDHDYDEEFNDEFEMEPSKIPKKLVNKQLSVLEDDAILNNEIDMELKTHHDSQHESDNKNSIEIEKSNVMMKQDSVIEEDLELNQIEENHKMDQYDQDTKQRKSVKICDSELVPHEKVREIRTAKQRWHWAYNRIVHQGQVFITCGSCACVYFYKINTQKNRSNA